MEKTRAQKSHATVPLIIKIDDNFKTFSQLNIQTMPFNINFVHIHMYKFVESPMRRYLWPTWKMLITLRGCWHKQHLGNMFDHWKITV